MIIRVLGNGKDAAGLARYLYGPGKANEHTNQRMVAGSPELHAEWGDAALTSRQATQVGRLLEASWRRQYAPELALTGAGFGGISRENLKAGEEAVAGQAHVFHATISLSAAEGQITDEQWQEVAERYMRGMGYIDNPDHPDAVWFAVHHGESANGNDHIHIAMCSTLRDGSMLPVHNSGIRSQQVRRETLEKLDFITPLHDEQHQANTPTLKGHTAAEHNIARERAAAGAGPAEPDRVILQRIVRGAAEQSSTEAEFINNVLSHRGVRIEPARWEPGNRDQVTGYKVGQRGGVAFTASKLASDLTLSKLRKNWTETPESAQLARDLWAGDATKLDPLRVSNDVDEDLKAAAQNLCDFNDNLAEMDPHDKAAWNDAAAGLAGTATVLATGRGAEFRTHAGRAADIFARQTLEDTWDTTPLPEPKVRTGLSGAEKATRHIQLALRAGGSSKHAGWFAVIQQITRATDAISDARQARGEFAAAAALRNDALPALRELERYTETMHADDGSVAGMRTPSERESDRILRERRDQERSAAATPAEMTEAAREAAEHASHGRRPDGAPTIATPGPNNQPGPQGPAIERQQGDDQRRGRGR